MDSADSTPPTATATPTSPSPSQGTSPTAPPAEPSSTTSPPTLPTPAPSQSPPGDPGSGNEVTEIWKSSFQTAAKAFDTEVIDLVQDINKHVVALGDLGDFAGSDDMGNKFKEGYLKAQTKAMDHISALVEAYPEIHTRLGKMSMNVDFAEWLNIQSLPKLPEQSLSDSNDTFTP